jgi:hypothetical protein
MTAAEQHRDDVRDPELTIGQLVAYEGEPLGRVVDRRVTKDGDWEVDVKTARTGFVLPFFEAELESVGGDLQ